MVYGTWNLERGTWNTAYLDTESRSGILFRAPSIHSSIFHSSHPSYLTRTVYHLRIEERTPWRSKQEGLISDASGKFDGIRRNQGFGWLVFWSIPALSLLHLQSMWFLFILSTCRDRFISHILSHPYPHSPHRRNVCNHRVLPAITPLPI